MALVKVPGERRQWALRAGAYTLGGLATSTVVGFLAGAIGRELGGQPGKAHLAAALAIGLVCLARETTLPSIPLPQARRQTPGTWAQRFRPATTAALWGLDIGLAFTTWMTFSGTWFVLSLAFLSGSAGSGALIMIAYWIGRALPVWLAPLFRVDAPGVPDSLAAIRHLRGHLRVIHVVALLVCMTSVVLIAFSL